MDIKVIDGNTFKQLMCGGADGIRTHIDEINELNVFPVPDGDTGTNMSRTIESGVTKILHTDSDCLEDIANDFARGSLFGARGNSGVILSQFFAGICDSLSGKKQATVFELADAYIQGVKRSYSAVANPVEGTILTVFRESAEYVKSHLSPDSTVEDFFRMAVEEGERSVQRTKDILPVLTEADVVDSGGAGYLWITKGMYATVRGEVNVDSLSFSTQTITASEIDYSLFTSDSALDEGYCTECLVRLQRAKTDIESFDAAAFASELENCACNSIVSVKDGDILKVHAHTMTPSDVLILCQKYGEFLNVKIENMSLQHSEKELKKEAKKKIHKKYGTVTVATGDGLKALFTTLGADVIIDGGQTGNPSAEQFLEAFSALDADDILVFPNNGNILLTAIQASELWEGGNVTVIPTKTLPEGYSALSVFNPSLPDRDAQIEDMLAAKNNVASCEITLAIRDTTIGGVHIKQGDYIGILGGEIVASGNSVADVICNTVSSLEDIDEREIITLFVGEDVEEDERADITELLEERFDDLTIEVYVGGQKIYNYLIAIE